jgi:hypothetical protein
MCTQCVASGREGGLHTPASAVRCGTRAQCVFSQGVASVRYIIRVHIYHMYSAYTMRAQCAFSQGVTQARHGSVDPTLTKLVR